VKGLRLLPIFTALLLFWSLTPAVATAAIENDVNTVALWRFNENTGVAFYDETNNHNDGGLAGSASWVQGVEGSALRFDSPSLATFGTTNFPSGTDPVTVEFWYKPMEVPYGEQFLWAYGGANAEHQALGVVVHSDLLWMWYGGYGGAGINVNWADYVNKWVHIAVVLDGTKGHLYLNGVSVAESNDVPNITTPSWGALGTLYGYGIYLDKSSIDDMRISNIARTPEEILSTYREHAPIGAISGTVFNDMPPVNGILDASDPRLPGWTVNLLAEDGTTVLATLKTDENGDYKFDNLAPGNYWVSETLGGPEWSNTTPLEREVGLDFTNGEMFGAIVDFGNEKPFLGFHSDAVLPYTGR
jgi:hypothetical protein